ncbi:cytochrome P450 [Daedaleopsis nitida]|nr:cytochrome P450 [Daedaleopsis nitida]
MAFLLIAYGATAILVVVFVLPRICARSTLKYIQGPPSPSFLLGHESELENRKDIGDPEFKWMQQYGTTWKIRGCFGTDIIMTADPKALQHIFQKAGYDYVKRPFLHHFAYLATGPGIITTNAHDHHRHRKSMNPAFSATHLRSFLPLFQRIGSKLSEKWKLQLANTNVGGMELMINEWLSHTTLDIIGEAAFQYDFGALDGGLSNPLSESYHNLAKDVAHNTSPAGLLIRATWDYTPQCILKLFRFLPFEPFIRLRNMERLFADYGKRMLRDKQIQSGDAEKHGNEKDLMSLLIKANCSTDPKMRLTEAEVMAQMATLTFAGHETTAVTLSFLLYELARHPRYQERMRKEIQNIRARVTERGDQDFTIEDLDSLSLTVNAIKETLRLHAVVSQLPRVASKDDILPLAYPIVTTHGETVTEIPIRAGQVVISSFAAYHQCLLASVLALDGVSREIIVIGLDALSVIEMQAILAELMEHFHFAPPAKEVEIQRTSVGLTMIPMIKGEEHLGTSMPIRISLAG